LREDRGPLLAGDTAVVENNERGRMMTRRLGI
jgi:hypothetical protein